MKRLVTLLLALVMVFSLTACGGKTAEAGSDYKIGIVTGTVSQDEEEYQAAQNLKAKYGDKVVTATYPDNFSTETEQTIATVTNMAAKTFVHISFERHLGYATISARQALFQENCARLGLEYVEATAPDPTGDAGVTGAQAWVTENIKVYVDQYGKDTAFFCTNCSMQVPLIQQCAELGAIYPQQCCPSPYHG